MTQVSYGFDYEFVGPETRNTKALPPVDAHGPEEPEYQFRFFATGPKPGTESTSLDQSTADVKVRLSATPEPVALAESLSLENARFVHPNRPETYYFTSALPDATIEELRSQYSQAAVSAADILDRAQSTKWPGTSLPWRTIQVELLNKPPKPPSVSHSSTNANQASARHKTEQSRTRPSKKRRILLRRRLALRSSLAAKTKASTEETEQEKRTRRNREKKVKRKEREKRKKLVAEEPRIEGEVKDASEVLTTEIEAQEGTEPDNNLALNTMAEGDHKSIPLAHSGPKQPPTQVPTRRTPTSRAPTAAAPDTEILQAKSKTPKSAYPTRLPP